jgi:multicomponent Na+:H+ antiporter subunit G
VRDLVALALIAGGLFFVLVSCVGLFRFPDFYSRSHALGKSDTLGTMLVLAGLAVYDGVDLSSFKLVLILIFVALGNPTATHALTRAALRSRDEMWSLRGSEKRE